MHRSENGLSGEYGVMQCVEDKRINEINETAILVSAFKNRLRAGLI